MNVSHSELACYRRCPREHVYRYRERVEPLVPAEALVRGKRAHMALADWWGPRIAWDPFEPEELLLSLSPQDRAMLRGYSLTYERPHLSNVRINVPFSLDLGFGVTLVGELDAHGYDGNGHEAIVEHKTTGSDIAPGSAYWREVVLTAPQPSAYLLAFPKATVLWDALRKPALRKLRAGKPNEETDDEFEARCLAAIAEDPTRYYQRATVVRLEHELEAFREETIEWAARIEQEAAGKPDLAVRNPDSCWTFGRPCDYFACCWEGRSLDSPEFQRRETNHTEEVAARAAKESTDDSATA